jgi:hypothetical protein
MTGAKILLNSLRNPMRLCPTFTSSGLSAISPPKLRQVKMPLPAMNRLFPAVHPGGAAAVICRFFLILPLQGSRSKVLLGAAGKVQGSRTGWLDKNLWRKGGGASADNIGFRPVPVQFKGKM